jgi:DNA invertase Pin-like site-specific DNA recombinase
MSTKVQRAHLSRPAFVYIRQSTLAQVFENRQSTERQYDLVEVAKRLGWEGEQVRVVDEDLGQSGASICNRPGFQRLTAEVSMGRVGAIVSLEVSRLARSSADWHRLLDLCAFANTLIVDDDGVYDPNDFNDRLVLGMKGTMSDAERHVMRLRLRGGKIHKAQKGELAFLPPTGYVLDGGKLALDPDEEVQRAVRLLFRRFGIDGTAFKVASYFREHGLLFPSRQRTAEHSLKWVPLTAARVISVLHNPCYAGVYAYGRRQTQKVLADGVIRSASRVVSDRGAWVSFIPDAHSAYVSLDEHSANLARLDDNRQGPMNTGRKGATRKGEAVLQGIVICGRCGRRMLCQHRSAKSAVYMCRGLCDGATCWLVPCAKVDEAIATQVLEVIAPPEVDLSLAVLKEVERQGDDVTQQWRLRIERARFDAERAARQYHAVEPENRLVARTLETKWNEKLRALAEVEQGLRDALAARRVELSLDDRRAVMRLARDLPRVWNAPTTSNAERKQIVRMLIEEVCLEPVDLPRRATKIRILWKTGAVTEVLAERPAPGDSRTPPSVQEAIRELVRQRLSDDAIAQHLNARGIRTARGLPFTGPNVLAQRHRHGISSGGPRGGRVCEPVHDERGCLSIRGLIEKFSVTEHIVRNWIEKGVIAPERGPRGTFWFTVDSAVEARIREAMARGYGPRSRPGGRRGGRCAAPLQDAKGRYSTRALVARYGVTWDIVRRWIATGVIVPDADSRHGDFRFRLTQAVERRIAKALRDGRGPRVRHAQADHRPHGRPKI